ncbi:MAG: hypothetical protein F4027_11060 [Rhodospirillaceae bacterium]|nr:hypothetical protein [Rhodospirillaceae bacterium]MYF87382.1 hypothetical protein [Rhodospirillaceae bacterium]MYH35733.1 hypothetical protein [Rhodospirillaceae bacterium]MYK15263.1 hypothetical protein [Rhodospirillaceae bacterium]MYK59101.1 hypothetical protein [Rhodospirillaceae bacterium]
MERAARLSRRRRPAAGRRAGQPVQGVEILGEIAENSRENLQYNNFFRKYDFSLDRHDHISYMARTDT